MGRRLGSVLFLVGFTFLAALATGDRVTMGGYVRKSKGDFNFRFGKGTGKGKSGNLISTFIVLFLSIDVAIIIMILYSGSSQDK